MRVLFVCNRYHPWVGGIETMISELGHWLHGWNHQVRVLTRRYPTSLPEFERHRDADVHRISLRGGIKAASVLAAWLRDRQELLCSDVVHVVGIRQPLPTLALALARAWGVPVVVSPGGGELPDALDPEPGRVWRDTRRDSRAVLEQADTVTAFSDDLAKRIRHAVASAVPEVLYAGLDVDEIQRAPRHRAATPYVLSLRRLDEQAKGVDLAIDAFRIIADRHPRLQLVIAGTGRLERALRQHALDAGVANRVQFIGDVDLVSACSLLKGAELTVVPSRSEAGGLVNVEAQAAGCPVVASRVGGIPEYIVDRVSGLLVPVGDVERLADAIASVLEDRGLRKQLVGGGLRHARRYDWSHQLPQYLDLYARARDAPTRRFVAWSPGTIELWNELQRW
jgi:glycosyltransferase involved in cell wall biosynthesis